MQGVQGRILLRPALVFLNLAVCALFKGVHDCRGLRVPERDDIINATAIPAFHLEMFRGCGEDLSDSLGRVLVHEIHRVMLLSERRYPGGWARLALGLMRLSPQRTVGHRRGFLLAIPWQRARDLPPDETDGIQLFAQSKGVNRMPYL